MLRSQSRSRQGLNQRGAHPTPAPASLGALALQGVGGGCPGLRVSSGTSSLASVGGSAHWLVFRAWVAEFADSCQSPG